MQSTDADGNALGGIRHPLITAPCALLGKPFHRADCPRDFAVGPNLPLPSADHSSFSPAGAEFTGLSAGASRIRTLGLAVTVSSCSRVILLRCLRDTVSRLRQGGHYASGQVIGITPRRFADRVPNNLLNVCNFAFRHAAGLHGEGNAQSNLSVPYRTSGDWLMPLYRGHAP